jgi:hypothetical protein
MTAAVASEAACALSMARWGTSRLDRMVDEILGREPPFLVRWADTGHEALVYPGPDAQIHHLHNEERPAQ